MSQQINGMTLAVSNPAALLHGCKASHRFTREGGSIGSHACAWSLQDRARRIRPLHGEIRWREHGFCIVDRSGETYMNGSDLSLTPGRHVRLTNGDRLQMGDYLIVAYVEEQGSLPGQRQLGQQTLTELMNDEQCPLQALMLSPLRHSPLPDHSTACLAADQDPLAALDAAAAQSQAARLFGDIFAPLKGDS